MTYVQPLHAYVETPFIGASLSKPHIDDTNVRNLHTKGMIWRESELAMVYALLLDVLT